MKKIALLSMFVLLLLVSLSATGNPRGYTQKLTSPGADITTIVTNPSSQTCPDYIATATITSSPGVISTATHPVTTIRIYKLTTNVITFYLQLANFPENPWVIGDVVHVTVTYIGALPSPGGTVTEWDMTIPSGTAGITILSPMQDVAPLPGGINPNPTIADTPAPVDHATLVPLATPALGWNYTHDEAFTDPIGYKVYFGTDPNLVGVIPFYVAGSVGPNTAPMPLLEANTHYYWRVVPTTDAGLKAGAPRTSRSSSAKGDAESCPIWDFTTEGGGPVFFDIEVVSSIPGAMIYRNGLESTFQAPHTFLEPEGVEVTFGMQELGTLITPPAQAITPTEDVTLTFTYGYPDVDAGGAEYTDGTAPLDIDVDPLGTGTDTYGVTVDTNGPGMIVVTVYDPPAKGVYEGYNNVLKIIDVWTDEVTNLEGTPVTVKYATDAPYEVALHWGGPANGWYPHVGPWSGYVFNGGPMSSIAEPLINFGPMSNYVDGVPWNFLTVGPLPAYAAKGPGTLQFIINDGTHTLPVELSSFTAVATAQMFVNLQWTTESETNNLGFNVFRSTDNVLNNAIPVNMSIISGTNSSSQHNYNFVDESVEASTTYYYWLQSVDFDGTSHFSTAVMVQTNSTATPPAAPTATALKNAYPNPFNVNSSTNIEMDVKNGETATMTIYNVLGQSVKTYVREAGSHKIVWNGRDDNGTLCGSGIYFYKLSSASTNVTKKMVVVK